MKMILIALVLALSACAAKPNFYNGNYYMSGDSNCRYMRQIGSTRVMCMDAESNDTGYRDAMTDQQLQMYQHNKHMEQMQNDALQDQINNLPDYTKHKYEKPYYYKY